MKLAEALLLRSDYQKRLAQVRERLKNNATQRADEDAPVEDPNALLDEANDLIDRLATLVEAITRTNATAAFDDGHTMSWALAERERLRRRHKIHTELAGAASSRERGSWGVRSEVRYKPTVNVGVIRNTADSLAQELRALNVRLQQRNWQIDLEE